MTYIVSYVLILALTRDLSVVCAGQFFEITKDAKTMEAGKPFLTSDVFECSEQKTCTTYTRTATSNGSADSRNVISSMSKTKDPSAQYRSCATALKMNDGKEGYYNIKHSNMLHSLKVECKITTNKAYAVFHHDSETLTNVTGKEKPCSFSKSINYAKNWDAIVSFVDSSTNCRQLTTFNCKHSKFFDSEGHYSYIVDRNRSFMRHIGGGPENGRGCNCGISQTCAKSGAACNCNTNDNVWRSDSGYVTEKFRLPLTKVCIGETGGLHEQMSFKIGPVECISAV